MKDKIEFIKELIDLAEERELSELSIDFKGMKVSIKKESQPPPAPTMMVGAHMASMLTPSIQLQADAAGKAEEEPPSNHVPVNSPLAGVFYRASKPGSPLFVNPDDIVERDQVLCIVEAMKIMNEITSEIKGKVVKICKENAEVVGEGDTLFYLEPVE
ncbi:MAG: hypothetical protein K8T10_16475 [Candidatus Eremiobacteraeota bacterium]|nr:hypothetical protein [Candidatus Eremiobacteraeota bacterium]